MVMVFQETLTDIAESWNYAPPTTQHKSVGFVDLFWQHIPCEVEWTVSRENAELAAPQVYANKLQMFFS